MQTGLESGAKAREAAVRQLEQGLPVQVPRGEDGLQVSWLPGSGGAELLTWMDGRGRVRRQEFSLLDDFFLWTRQTGLRTGALLPYGSARAASVLFDARPSAWRVARAAAALASYRGQDPGLLHLQRLLARAGQGLPVATGLREEADGPQQEEEEKEAPSARRRWLGWIALVLLGAMGLGILAAVCA